MQSEPALTSSAARLQNLSLYRSTLAHHKREYSRLNGSIAECRSRANLLSSVRSDIELFRTTSRVDGSRSFADYMLHEHERIDRSLNIADTVLSQAYAVNADFTQQRVILASINKRIIHGAKQLPGINTLIAKINTRKKRDSVILALFVSACFITLLFLR